VDDAFSGRDIAATTFAGTFDGLGHAAPQSVFSAYISMRSNAKFSTEPIDDVDKSRELTRFFAGRV